MKEQTVHAQLEAAGVDVGTIHRNLPAPELTARSLARKEGILAANGALVVTTGARTGRSPADRYIVDDEGAAGVMLGRSQPARAARPSSSGSSSARASTSARARSTSSTASSAPSRSTGCRSAWSRTPPGTRSLPTRCSCGPQPIELEGFAPGFTVIDCGALPADARRGVFVGISFSRKLVLIMGSMYAGEIKKALFTVMNYLLPERDVLPMHCSATSGDGRRRALLRPLRDGQDDALGRPVPPPHRRRRDRLERPRRLQLRGRLLRQGDPPVRPSRAADLPAIRFGSVLENVVVDPHTRAIDWDDDSITENTRATYPSTTSPGAIATGVAGSRATSSSSPATRTACSRPSPSSRRRWPATTSSPASRPGGGHGGRGGRPRAHVLACFGAPFMPRDPAWLRDDAGRAAALAPTQCWLVNTGWSGGPYGVGKRMRIAVTRSLLKAALTGELDARGLRAPPGVPRARAGALPGRAREAARRALDVGGSARPTTRAPPSCPPLRRELREVRRPRAGRARRGRPRRRAR